MLDQKLSLVCRFFLLIELCGALFLGLITSGATSLAETNQTIVASSPPENPSAKSGSCQTDSGLGLSPNEKNLIKQLQSDPKTELQIACHTATGKVRFMAVSASKTIATSGISSTDSPEQNARNFLGTYGALFGLKNQATELTLQKLIPAEQSKANFVRFQQVYQGVRVMAGEITVQVDPNRQVRSVTGELLPEPKQLSTTPTIDIKQAQDLAKTAIAKQFELNSTDLVTYQPELWVYNAGLLNSEPSPLTQLVWRMRVEATTAKNELVDELVLIDAHKGSLALHFSQVETIRDRRICDLKREIIIQLRDCTQPVRREGGAATGDVEVDRAYNFLGDTYDFYKNYFNRDSLDGQGLPIKATVKICVAGFEIYCPYLNAFWSPDMQQMYFGEQLTVDDIVGHELTHGFTQFTSNLYYYSQSGAINESLSDVFGEFVDQTNATDGAAGNSPSLRWLQGEDFKAGGVRDMKDPPRLGSPDRVGSPYYYTGTEDSAGVHTNSGVNNKAAFLMTDGGIFNNYTINPLGLNKTAQIYYQTATKYLTTGSDYQDLHDFLPQACQDLVGQFAITANDCNEVKKVVDATEMTLSLPIYREKAPICENNLTPNDIFYDSFEVDGLFGWTTKSTPDMSANWQRDSGFFTNGKYGLYATSSYQKNEATVRTTKSFKVSAGAYLHFKHFHNLESGREGSTTGYDGGVVEYSNDDGTTWQSTENMFTHSGYNFTIHSGYDSSLKGQHAFSGPSKRYYASRIDLNSLKDQNIQIRFRIASDIDTASWGWVIDEVRVYTCPEPPITLKSSPNPANLGESVTFTATVSPVVGSNLVTFTNGANLLASVPLMDGKATFATSSLPVGINFIQAHYKYSSNSTQFVTLAQVIKDSSSQQTTLNLTSSANPVLSGQSFQLTANISPPTATGTITFRQLPTGTVLGTASLNAGNAVLNLPNLAWGYYTIQAYYPGGGGLSPAASNLLVQHVCDPLIVSSTTDDGSGTNCGTLSYALAHAATVPAASVAFGLTSGNTITFTGPLAVAIEPGVKVIGQTVCSNVSRININGNGLAGGLELGGNNLLRGLLIYGFEGTQLRIAPGSSGNRLQCTTSRVGR